MQNNYKCEVCQALNADFRKYRKVTGMIILSSTSFTKPKALCNKHKHTEGIKITLRNIILGWWGIHAFFWNIISLFENLRGGYNITKEVEQSYLTHLQQSAEAMNKQNKP